MSVKAEAMAPDTVTIEIDGRPCQASKGAMIIEIADREGIKIPRFCYHRKLPIAANCRMCLVDVEKAPKPLPACATPIVDGMKIFTRSRRALDAQRAVMEFLLINHPLDCPICDQGGECELQDLSLGYGRGVSRFVESKRVVKDENLGSLIATDMTRCICCTRCVRFLSEITGSNEMGGIGRGEKTVIGTYIGRSIDSEMSGNIIDVCPVGALTNKVFRFQARAWELLAHESVAAHDCVGSNLFIHTRKGRILRVVPRDNDAINECWLADRDRYSHQGLYADDRLTVPRIKRDGKWQDSDWEQALEIAAQALRDAGAEKSLGTLVSPNSTLEEMFLVQKLSHALGSNNIDHRLRQLDFSDQDAMPLDPRLQLQVAAMSRLDSVLIIGADIHHEQPILGHKMRQAWKNGACVSAVNPMAFTTRFDLAQNLTGDPWKMLADVAATAVALAKLSGCKTPARLAALTSRARAGKAHKAIAQSLYRGEHAAIWVGGIGQQLPNSAQLLALARWIAEMANATCCVVPQGANSVGAWDAGVLPHRGVAGRQRENPGLNAREMIEQGCSSYLLYQVEPGLDHGLGRAARDAIAAADRVVYLGAFAGPEVCELADVMLPVGLMPEISGTLINLNGLAQRSQAAVHPPGQARPGWKVLRVLGNLLELGGFEYVSVDDVYAEFTTTMDGVSRDPAMDCAIAAAGPRPDGLIRLGAVALYDGDAMVRRARALQETVHATAANIALNAAECRRQNIAQGDEVTVKQGSHTAALQVTLDARVPDGMAWIAAGSTAAERLGVATGPISLEIE